MQPCIKNPVARSSSVQFVRASRDGQANRSNSLIAKKRSCQCMKCAIPIPPSSPKTPEKDNKTPFKLSQLPKSRHVHFQSTSTPYGSRTVSSDISSDIELNLPKDEIAAVERTPEATKKPRNDRRSSPYPLLIPTELTLSLARVSPLTIHEELTCRRGKEDARFAAPPPSSSSTTTTIDSVYYDGETAATEEQYSWSEHTEPKMGACVSKRPHNAHEQKNRSLESLDKSENGDDVNEEEATKSMKFKLKRDSIAVTKVRLMKHQIQHENTIGEEDEDDVSRDEGRTIDHVHFNEQTNQRPGLPNDSGLSLNSCSDSNNGSPQSDRSGDYSCEDVIELTKETDVDSSKEVCLSENVSIRPFKKPEIMDEREFDFKSIRAKAQGILESQLTSTTSQRTKT